MTRQTEQNHLKKAGSYSNAKKAAQKWQPLSIGLKVSLGLS